MAGYSSRQSTYTDGDTISAADTNDEFNAILTAFGTSGHTHDGSAGNGGAVTSLVTNAPILGAGTDADIVLTFNTSTLDGVLSWMEDEDYFQFSDDILMTTTEKVQLRDAAIYLYSSADGQADLVADSVIQVTAPTVNVEASTAITLESDSVTFGEGGNTDVVLNFNGNDNDGVLTWMEDEDYFLFSDDILINSTEKIQFGDTASFIQQSSDGVLRIDGEATIDMNASTAVLISNDLKLDSDAAVLAFGGNSEITLTHDHDVGLKLKHTATADDKPIVLTLQTGEQDMAANDVMGAIRFQAPDEAQGTDAILVAAGIQAVAEGDFSSSNNATRLEFHTGASEAAASKMQLSSAGVLTLSAGGIVIPDAGNIGSASDTDSLTIDSSGNVTASQNLTVTGNFTVNGTTTTVNTATLSVEDPLIILASGNNAADTVDIGFYGLYDTSGSQDLYAGLFRDANDSGKFKLFKDLQAAPTTTVNTSGTGYAVGTLVANLEGNVTGNCSGTAATVTTAAQSSITSLGTLTSVVIADAGNIGSASDTDAMAISSGGVVNFTQAPTVASAAIKTAGKETIYIPAAAMYPTTTNGCAALAQVEGTAGRPELKCLDFDPSSDENAQFTVSFPKSWNEGTITFRAFFTVSGTNTGTVSWALSGGSIADNGVIDTAFGTAVAPTAKAHSGTSNDLDVTAESGNVTIANAAADTMTFFNVLRDVSADDQTGDARLLGIQLFFTTDAANDA